MSKATLDALEEAIRAHVLDSLQEVEDPEDRDPGLLTTWVIFTEHRSNESGPEGEAVWNRGYITPEASPAQTVGCARLGIRELEFDLGA